MTNSRSALRQIPTDIDPKVRRALEEMRNEIIRISGQQVVVQAPSRPIPSGGSSLPAGGIVSKAQGGFGEDASALATRIEELNQLVGVTSGVQEQLDDKQALDDVLTALVTLLTGKTVTIGANDSGGVGFRALVVPNV